jgi:hypothetical protein
MNNDLYGRSPIEADSFIVSSAFPDPKMHGAGFQARLSGSTAEFLSMYLLMMQGEYPFGVNTNTETHSNTHNDNNNDNNNNNNNNKLYLGMLMAMCVYIRICV